MQRLGLLLLVVFCASSGVHGAVINFNTSLTSNQTGFNLRDPAIYVEGVVPGPQDTLYIYSGDQDKLYHFYIAANASLTIGELVINGSSYSFNIVGNFTVENAFFGTTYSGNSKYLTIQGGIMTVTGNFAASIGMEIYGGGLFQQIASSSKASFVGDRLLNLRIDEGATFFSNASVIFNNSQALTSKGGSFYSYGSTTILGTIAYVMGAKNASYLGDLVLRDTKNTMVYNDVNARSVSLFSVTAIISLVSPIQYAFIDANSVMIFKFANGQVIGSPNSTVAPLQGSGRLVISDSTITIFNLNQLTLLLTFQGDSEFYFTSTFFEPDTSLFEFEDSSYVYFVLLQGYFSLKGKSSINGQIIINYGALSLSGTTMLRNSGSYNSVINTIKGDLVFVVPEYHPPALLWDGAGMLNPVAIVVPNNAYLSINSNCQMSATLFTNNGTLIVSPKHNLEISGDYNQEINGTLVTDSLLESSSVPLAVAGDVYLKGGELKFSTAKKVKTNYNVTVISTGELYNVKFRKVSTYVSEPDFNFNISYTRQSVILSLTPKKSEINAPENLDMDIGSDDSDLTYAAPLVIIGCAILAFMLFWGVKKRMLDN